MASRVERWEGYRSWRRAWSAGRGRPADLGIRVGQPRGEMIEDEEQTPTAAEKLSVLSGEVGEGRHALLARQPVARPELAKDGGQALHRVAAVVAPSTAVASGRSRRCAGTRRALAAGRIAPSAVGGAGGRHRHAARAAAPPLGLAPARAAAVDFQPAGDDGVSGCSAGQVDRVAQLAVGRLRQEAAQQALQSLRLSWLRASLLGESDDDGLRCGTCLREPLGE